LKTRLNFRKFYSRYVLSQSESSLSLNFVRVMSKSETTFTSQT